MDCDCDFILPKNDFGSAHYDNCFTVWTRKNPGKKYPKNKDGSLNLPNPHLATLSHDSIYHLGLHSNKNDLKALFWDIKFVCVGGTKHRMKELAAYLADVLKITFDEKNLTKHSHRYAMYKVGKVLCVSHGIGIPSMTVMLQELLKVLYYARSKNPIFFRIGTSGGVGLEPGSVVISSCGLNGRLEKSYEVAVLGKTINHSAIFDRRLVEELSSLSKYEDSFLTAVGSTFAADDFYRGQARLDGPFCDYSEEEKTSFVLRLQEMGVKNIEMEATAFAALTSAVAVRAAELCVTLVDRLKDDQVEVSKTTSIEWQKRPMHIVGRYIAKYYQNHTQ